MIRYLESARTEFEAAVDYYVKRQRRMTVRELITSKKRRVTILALSEVGVFVAGCGLVVINPLFGFIGLAGFVACLVTVTLAYVFDFRCPSCGVDLSALVARGWAFSIDPRIKCCPYCRVEMDSLATPGKASAGLDWDA